MAVPVAFYAPLKSPNHPSPSGDRTMARLLLDGLRRAGYGPALASELRTYEALGDALAQRALAEASRREADRLSAHWAGSPSPPRLWFTYHSYYKAPDHLGPEMARRFGLPYVVAEASSAGKRAGGPWALGHEAAEAAIAAADRLFVMTAHDREALARDAGLRPKLVELPPFLDASLWPDPGPVARAAGGPVRLLAVGMMRPGDKLASYRLLAAALARIEALPWRLDIVGDGPARQDVDDAFAPLCERVTVRGALAQREVADLCRDVDVLVWPAVNEAYGMALLEAQATGLPIVAGGYGGVASAMRAGVTGLMPAPGDPEAFARDLVCLILDPARRTAMGAAAARFVRSERGLAGAADILRATLGPLLQESAAA